MLFYTYLRFATLLILQGFFLFLPLQRRVHLERFSALEKADAWRVHVRRRRLSKAN